MSVKDPDMIRYKYDEVMETVKWVDKIPTINFPTSWAIRVIPPFNGAVVRFRVKKGNASVSIYLDCYDNLGIYGSPYWEVYPHNDDVFRCGINEVDRLLKAISESIKEQNKKTK